MALHCGHTALRDALLCGLVGPQVPSPAQQSRSTAVRRSGVRAAGGRVGRPLDQTFVYAPLDPAGCRVRVCAGYRPGRQSCSNSRRKRVRSTFVSSHHAPGTERLESPPVPSTSFQSFFISIPLVVAVVVVVGRFSCICLLHFCRTCAPPTFQVSD